MAKKKIISGKKKSAKKQPIPSPAAPPGANTSAESVSLSSAWPDSFVSFRVALFMVCASLVLATLLFGTAALGGFAAVKISLAQRLGMFMPEMISAASFDLAFALCGMCVVIFIGVIHPALGLALLLLARAWLDGYTFPGDNVYFTWSLFALLAIWLLKALRHRIPIRAPLPVLLFGMFILLLLVTLPHAYQYYNTYQLLWLWVGYGVLLLLVVNAVRDRISLGLLLAVFMAAMGIQALFSILHFEYLLPHLRTVIQDPAILRQYFNTDVITPELARRFMVNRAFGSMLFPNALAAYLLLGIPFACIMVVPYWREMGAGLRTVPKKGAPPETVEERVTILAVAVVSGVLGFVAVFFITHFPREYRETPLPFYFHATPLGLFAFVVACSVGIVNALLLLRYGLRGWWLLIRFSATAVLAPLLLYTLWITYSRGAYVALFFAALWGLVLYRTTPAHLERFFFKSTLRRLGLAVAVLVAVTVLTAVLTAGLAMTAASAQLAPPQPSEQESTPDPRTQLHSEGLTLSASDMVDPASFRLRLGYWHVTLLMALDNPLTGVGLGNFATAYPIYQYIGVADVREAHNGFLQMFAETGLAGGLVFAVFWLYFLLWGAICVIREKQRDEKLLLLALYTGVVAFCAHAFLDINFSHPSLMLFALIFTGLFYARTTRAQEPPATAPGEHVAETQRTGPFFVAHGLAVAVLLTLLLLFSMASTKIYVQQLALNRLSFINVSNDTELARRMRAGQFFLANLTQYAQVRRQTGEIGTPPRVPVSLARLFLDDFNEIARWVVFYKPSPDVARRYLLVEAGEPVPPNGLMAVIEPYPVRVHTLPRIEQWLDELKQHDKRFPHSVELAMNIARWYELHVHWVHGPDPERQRQRTEWIEQYHYWAKTMVYRNPYNADMRMFYARALLWPALNAEEWDSEDLIDRALEQWDAALPLAPISPMHRYHYAATLEDTSDYFARQGDEEWATHHAERARELRAEADALQQERQEAMLYP